MDLITIVRLYQTCDVKRIKYKMLSNWSLYKLFLKSMQMCNWNIFFRTLVIYSNMNIFVRFWMFCGRYYKIVYSLLSNTIVPKYFWSTQTKSYYPFALWYIHLFLLKSCYFMKFSCKFFWLKPKGLYKWFKILPFPKKINQILFSPLFQVAEIRLRSNRWNRKWNSF